MPRHAFVIARVLIAALLLGMVFRFVPVPDVVAILKHGSLPLLLAAISVQFGNRWLATWQMGVIASSQGVAIDRAMLYRIVLVVQFYALFLPGALAGGAATWLKYIEHGVPGTAAAAMTVLNRAAGLFMLLPLAAIALLADPSLEVDPKLAFGALLATCAMLVFLYRSPADRPLTARPANALMPAVLQVLSRVESFRRIPRADRSRVLAGACVTELANALAMWLFALSIGLPISPWSALWIRCLLQLALLLPITVAGLGVREASLIAFCSVIGVPASDAVAWSLVVLCGTVCIAVTGGALELAASWKVASNTRTARRRQS